MNKKLLNKIKGKFTYPSQNWDKLVSLWEDDEPISFYSWECPPRQIKIDKKNGRWVNFDIDIKSIVEGKKLDEFTELPRLTSQWEKEKWFIETIVNQNPNATYTKIIADTNGLYLYTKSKDILGEKKIRLLSNKFRRYLESKSKELLDNNSPNLVLYTKFQGKFRSEYEMFFDLVYKSIGSEEEIVSKDLLDYWMDRMINHIGLTQKDKKYRLDILKRVIASYAAEGMVFELLNNLNILPNPVWVNWEEKPESAQTTELLRERYGLSPIPVIYFV